MKHLTSLALAALLTAPAAAGAQTAATTTAGADAAGTWNAVFNTQQGQIPATLKLQRSGEKIAGTITSADGESPVEAEVKGKTLTVWFNYAPHGSQPIPIEMNGTVDGDSAKGTMNAGGSPAGDWTATRAKGDSKTGAPAASTTSAATPAAAGKDLSGTWNIALALEAISATPTMTVTQSGDKLSGDYISQQYGKFPLSGSVKGSDVTFSVSMNIEGNAITAVYTGAVQADGSLKGSVNIGDAMTGTFVASRKQ